MKKDLIVTTISENYNWVDIKNWIMSLKNTSYDGDILVLAYNFSPNHEYIVKLKELGCIILTPNNTYRAEKENNFIWNSGHTTPANANKLIHNVRLFHIWQYFEETKNDALYDRIIFTDGRDIIFQANPSEWLNKFMTKDILVPSEGVLYKDEPWGNDNLMRCFGPHVYEEMKDNSIYNAGSMAGDWKTFVDFSLNVYKTIESIQNDVPDQAGVNFLLNLETYKSITKFNDHDVNWACQLGTTANPHKINHFRPNLLSPEPVFDGHHIYTSKGEKYCLVHQYNKVPDWQAKLEKIYG